MARFTQTTEQQRRFDPTQSLVADLPGGWAFDARASEEATDDAHATCVHIFRSTDGPYRVRVVQVREANEYSVQRRRTGDETRSPTTPDEQTIGTADPNGLRPATAAARVMMAEVSAHYAEDER